MSIEDETGTGETAPRQAAGLWNFLPIALAVLLIFWCSKILESAVGSNGEGVKRAFESANYLFLAGGAVLTVIGLIVGAVGRKQLGWSFGYTAAVVLALGAMFAFVIHSIAV